MNSCRVLFPYPVTENLSEEEVNKWFRFYKKSSSVFRDSRYEEGLWRRTQNEENKKHSGWSEKENGMRRRMVHYEYKYDLVRDGCNKDYRIAIVEFYLWWHICMPKSEISIYLERLYSDLQLNGWKKIFWIGNGEQMFSFGDLYVKILECKPKDNLYNQLHSHQFPDSYLMLEVTFFSIGNHKDENFIMKPWKILSTGIRAKDKRGNPKVNPWSDIKDFFPAQLELGCGPSIEANIPPLNYLHKVYCVTDPKSGEFIFDFHKDRLVTNLISDPNKSLILLSEMYRKCFMAEPTYFYHTIKEMHERGFVVGPVITNSFDGLPNRVGLGEIFVRQYEESNITPKIEFHPKAKSLFVVGSHADRRRIQRAARQKGLLVAYVDPEGYFSEDQFKEYHLESPQDNDVLFRVTADQFAKRINKFVL